MNRLSDRDSLYAGTDDGRLWRTKDGGTTWDDIRKEPLPIRWVSRIVASQHDFGTLYVTQTGRRDDDAQVYIWRSTDFGETWEDISGNIPAGPVNVIREDPVEKKILYAGTDVGVYVSMDSGENWQVMGKPALHLCTRPVNPSGREPYYNCHARARYVYSGCRSD